MYSTSEVAEMLNVTRRDVSYHCKRLGIKKIGNVYMLTKKDIEKIKNKGKSNGKD